MSTQSSVSLDSVRVARNFDTSRDSLWKGISTNHHRALWWPHSTLELRPGGAVVSPGEVSNGSNCDQTGMVDVLIHGHAFGFAWRRPQDRDDTSVLITLTSLLGSTQLSILEIGFRTLPDAVQRINESSDQWTRRLEALAGVVTQPSD